MAAPNDAGGLERQLSERVRDGDRAALGELYDRYAPVAIALALRLTGSMAGAEDVVHDAFVTAWLKIGGFDPNRGTLRSWLLTIVRNRAIDRVRTSRPRIEIGKADELALLRTGPNPTVEAALATIDREEIVRAVSSLPDEQRQAIELAYFEGHTYREIAEITGVPPGTASGRLRLALAKLRTLLGGRLDELARVQADQATLGAPPTPATPDQMHQ